MDSRHRQVDQTMFFFVRFVGTIAVCRTQLQPLTGPDEATFQNKIKAASNIELTTWHCFYVIRYPYGGRKNIYSVPLGFSIGTLEMISIFM